MGVPTSISHQGPELHCILGNHSAVSLKSYSGEEARWTCSKTEEERTHRVPLWARCHISLSTSSSKTEQLYELSGSLQRERRNWSLERWTNFPVSYLIMDRSEIWTQSCLIHKWALLPYTTQSLHASDLESPRNKTEDVWGLPWWSSGLDCTLNAGDLGLIPGQGTRSHMPQPRLSTVKQTNKNQPTRGRLISLIIRSNEQHGKQPFKGYVQFDFTKTY